LYQTCKVTHRLISGHEQVPIQLICLENATWSDDDLYTCIPSIFSLLLLLLFVLVLCEIIALEIHVE